MAALLPAVLEGIWAAQIPLAERRRLCARTAAALALGVHVDAASDGLSVTTLEEALQVVAGHAGRERISITDAKDWLRQHGGNAGQKLASRLARLSKARNVAAHPDTSLVRDLRACQHVPAGAKPVADDVQIWSSEADTVAGATTTDGATSCTGTSDVVGQQTHSEQCFRDGLRRQRAGWYRMPCAPTGVPAAKVRFAGTEPWIHRICEHYINFNRGRRGGRASHRPHDGR